MAVTGQLVGGGVGWFHRDGVTSFGSGVGLWTMFEAGRWKFHRWRFILYGKCDRDFYCAACLALIMMSSHDLLLSFCFHQRSIIQIKQLICLRKMTHCYVFVILITLMFECTSKRSSLNKMPKDKEMFKFWEIFPSVLLASRHKSLVAF